MTTYSKETPIYNSDAIADAIDEAGETATSYITEVTNDGIWVTPSNAKPSSGAAVSTTTGWHISDVLEYFKLGASWIKLWVESNVSKLRLGLGTSGHVILDSSGMEVFAGSNGSSSVAKLGSTVRVGTSDGGHVSIENDMIKMASDSGVPIFSAEADSWDDSSHAYLFGDDVGGSGLTYWLVFGHESLYDDTAGGFHPSETYRWAVDGRAFEWVMPSVDGDGYYTLSDSTKAYLDRFLGANEQGGSNPFALIYKSSPGTVRVYPQGASVSDPYVSCTTRSASIANMSFAGDIAMAGDILDGNGDNKLAPLTTTHNFTSQSIASKSMSYVNLGSDTAKSGYVPISVVFNLSSMSNYSNLVASALQDSGGYIYSRIYNNGSSASTGSFSATVYWLPA